MTNTTNTTCMKRKTLTIAALLLIAAVLLVSCGRKGLVSDDVSYLASLYDLAGYYVTYYEEGDGMLSDLEREMRSSMDPQPQGNLKGYLMAQNYENGGMEVEVFVFDSSDDAKLLLEYLSGNGSFVPGESEIRRSKNVVYMGYIANLDLIEDN